MGCFNKAEENENKEISRKPSDSRFKQQTMKAWQPVLTASTVMPIFFLVAAIFVPIGIALLVSSNQIKELVIEYSTDCEKISCAKNEAEEIMRNNSCICEIGFTLDTKWTGDIYFYYGLSNFYQNHRRYVRSRDDTQLNGQLSQSVNSNCDPFSKAKVGVNKTSEKPILPCGAIANSLFNDTFVIKNLNSKVVPFTDKNIAWKSDVGTKFKNPKDIKEFDAFAKPHAWTKNISQLEDHLENRDFIVWMRVAAFPTFRKLYRKLDYDADNIGPYGSGLPSGKYTLQINYNFPVRAFGGKKRFILTTASWIGGKNPFLGICYIVIGSLCVVFGFIFLVIHMKSTKSGSR